jgi:hypothetical protein
VKSFAQAVTAFLDQYRANGRFISVDPDEDGKKQAIFVTDDGKVNPDSSDPGKWADFRPEGVAKKPKPHRDSPGQLGTHEDPFTGKYRRKPEVQKKADLDGEPEQKEGDEKPNIQYKRKDIGLEPFRTIPRKLNKDGTPRKGSKSKKVMSEGVKGVKRYDRETGKFKTLTKSGKYINRGESQKFEDVAREVGFDADYEPTSEDIARLREVAKEVQQRHNEGVQEIVDAMRQLFAGEYRGLSWWQTKARAAQDPDELNAFGLDEIINGQRYSDSETNLLPIIRAHAGYLLEGGDVDEQAVFEALRKPLPKPLPLTNEDIVSQAAEIYAERKDDIFEDPAYKQLEQERQEALEADDYEESERLLEVMAQKFPTQFNIIFGDTEAMWDDDGESVPFQAASFAEAVAYYSTQPGLWEQFTKKKDKQEKLFDSTGKSWKDQPRVPKGSNKGGQWTRGNFKANTANMREARKDFERDFNLTNDHPTSDTRQKRKNVRKLADKHGGLKALSKLKPQEMSHEQLVLKSAMEIQESRDKFDSLPTSDTKEWIQNHIRNRPHGRVDWLSYREFHKELVNDIGEEQAAKELAEIEKSYGYKGTLNTGGEFHKLLQEIALLHPEAKRFGEVAANLARLEGKRGLDAIMKKHRNAVRNAVKRGEEVPEYAYEMYHDATWSPDQRSTKGTKQYVNYVDNYKKTDKFRLLASEGRKYRQLAKEQVDEVRKKFVTKIKKAQAERNKVNEAAKEAIAIAIEAESDGDAAKMQEYKDKYYQLVDERNRLRTEEKQLIAKTLSGFKSNRRQPEGQTAIELKPKGFNEAYAGGKAKNAVAWIESISDGSIPNFSVEMSTIKKRRSQYDPSRNRVEMGAGEESMAVLIHELGHAIETNTHIGRLGKAFYAQAVQKDPTRSLKLKNSNYDPDEVASKDGFLTAYTGKFYNSASSTEVISMGLQHLYEDAAEFAEKSPDHFNFMVAALRGLI